MLIKYTTNNSGGHWWLKDHDWLGLEVAGWAVEWVVPHWLGASAMHAYREFDTPGAAMREFESIVGKSVSDEGCECCGAPHIFSWSEGSAEGDECFLYLRDNEEDD